MAEPVAAALLAAVAAVVGLFIGAVGVGGVLLIPFLVLLGGLGIHSAAATALFTFIFTGLLGACLFQRRGTMQWRLAVPVCGGALAAGYAGSSVAARIDPRLLSLLIAWISMVAGLYVFRPARPAASQRDGHGRKDLATLLAVGGASGFGSGLSGAGGPLFSVPIMVILGFAPLATIGAGQAVQMVAAASATIATLQDGRVDYAIASWVTVFELAGVVAGAKLAHAVSAAMLRRMAGALCVVVGALMLLRAL